MEILFLLIFFLSTLDLTQSLQTLESSTILKLGTPNCFVAVYENVTIQTTGQSGEIYYNRQIPYSNKNHYKKPHIIASTFKVQSSTPGIRISRTFEDRDTYENRTEIGFIFYGKDTHGNVSFLMEYTVDGILTYNEDHNEFSWYYSNVSGPVTTTLFLNTNFNESLVFAQPQPTQHSSNHLSWSFSNANHLHIQISLPYLSGDIKCESSTKLWLVIVGSVLLGVFLFVVIIFSVLVYKAFKKKHKYLVFKNEMDDSEINDEL
ncbi:F-box and FNIP repeat-containing protein [Acrasis kona]|uniref:F-box and FNIP repeat-containing protein n=1 Tax=Acrasis kona TaxID=1008807 RepID=A0AAW2ZI12_9EUKA